MSKRIIYSLWNDSVTRDKQDFDEKKQQFIKYKPQLIKCKKLYAEKCNAEFVLFDTFSCDYDNVQFEKIKRFEELAETHDEVLYLDFDVVPTTNLNIFEELPLNKISMHALERNPTFNELCIALNSSIDSQNMYAKTAAKKAMLMLEDVDSNDLVYNTGVMLGSSKAIKQLRFFERLDEMKTLLDEAKEDSIYPDSISNSFFYNNEVFISYLIERYDIPHFDLPMNWNYIIDYTVPIPSDSAHFQHYVNKQFELAF